MAPCLLYPLVLDVGTNTLNPRFHALSAELGQYLRHVEVAECHQLPARAVRSDLSDVNCPDFGSADNGHSANQSGHS